MSRPYDESNEFDPYAACEAMREEIEWQIKEWERERQEEMQRDQINSQ